MRGTYEKIMIRTIAQIIGYIAVAENIMIYISNCRERILLWKFVSDTLCMLNYLLMGGFTGAALNGVAMIREAVFSLRGKVEWTNQKWVPALFLALTWLSPVMEWTTKDFSWIPLLPAFGSMIFVAGFYSKNTMRIKVSSLFGNAFWMAYAISITNWAGMTGNILMAISAMIGILREKDKRRIEEKEEKNSDE